MDITFRCLPKFDAVLPRPVPAVSKLPEWLKTMPQTVFSKRQQKEIVTAKQCLPFVDAMTCGFLMLLAADIKIEDGVFTWDKNALDGESPLSAQENIQTIGTPFFDREQYLVRFNNFWAIETPPGYSLLVTHPVNRHDLPFLTVTGLVDTDRYCDSFVNFPARWRDPHFRGVLEKGTPIAQCLPLKREHWKPHIEIMDSEGIRRLVEVSEAIASGPGVYRREFRAHGDS